MRLVYTRPYAPEAQGKVDRFNRVGDSFLAEVRLAQPTTWDDFNATFQVWLAECSQRQPHSALPDGPHPAAAYRGAAEPLRLVDSEPLTAAFHRVEPRQVDKTGCSSCSGQKYEGGVTWVGQPVDVVYAPTDRTTVTIEAAGAAPWTARPLPIGPHAGTRPPLPDQ